MAEIILNGMADYDRQPEVFSANMIRHAQKFSWSQCIDDYRSMYKEVIKG
jgi:glycosyltransferase involved in cell wall biosynthesis